MIGTEGNILATERFKGDDTQYYLYNKDIQGSTTSLVKEDGSADATYQYTDYGETIIHGDDQAKNEVCYTGGIYDQSTGLYYLNARYYNPEDGRFMTEDTYRGDTTKSETGHLYVYCANNPVNYVDPSGHFLVSTAVLVGVGVGGIVGAIAGSYKGRLVAKRLGYKGKKRNLFIATYGIKGAAVGAIIGAFAGYGIGVCYGASSSSGLAVKGVNSAIRRVASDQNKVRHIMQSKHAWTKVTKKNQWKYVKPIVKKEMKSGKMEAIGKTKRKEIVYKFVYNYKEKIIEGTCIAKKGVVKLSDAWLKQLVYDNQPFFSLNQTGKTNRELYILWKQNKRDDIFLLLYTQLWMALEEVYMENVIDYYKKDCYEKKLFFELVEYQKRFFKKNIKIQLLTGYFYATTEYLFFLNKENDIYNIVDEGKNIIKKLYDNNQEKFEVYIFYICILQGKRKKWIKKRKWYLREIKKLFPSNSEIDQYFREIFLL